MSGNRFHLEALVGALDAKRLAEGLSWREVAAQADVSASTLTRLQQNRRPDVDTFAALVGWLRVSADEFLTAPEGKNADLSVTAAHLQRGKRRQKPSDREAQLMSELLQKAHELAKHLKA